MAQETKQSQAPLLCATGCGFYGNPRTDGMCSVCYRDFLQRQNGSDISRNSVCVCFCVKGASDSTAVASVQKNVSIDELFRSAGSVEDGARRGKRKLNEILQLDEDGGECSVSVCGNLSTASGSDVSVLSSTTEADKSKPKKNRCFTCRKKVGLTGFDCRCGSLFCGIHRYSDAHNCSFDYKAEAAEKIRKENPVVAGEKIKKI
uniref:Zinc finger, AN1-type domain 6 n=1 Tax=Pygocentrus nattereri TaxID=42514 RepID=A0AAR2LQZ6_PYGNA